MIDIENFWWREFDVRDLLPNGWKEDIYRVVNQYAVNRDLSPTSVTSREAAYVKAVPVRTVGGRNVKRELPWLWDLYERQFCELGASCISEPVVIATDDRIAVNLNVQSGTEMRYECHVDSNPLEGLLYVTEHSDGTGGELIICNTPNAHSVEEVEADCTIVRPHAGHLVFFDARKFPHYVRSLKQQEAIRIVAAMNYYTHSWPESNRPPDLNRHLFGEN